MKLMLLPLARLKVLLDPQKYVLRYPDYPEKGAFIEYCTYDQPKRINGEFSKGYWVFHYDKYKQEIWDDSNFIREAWASEIFRATNMKHSRYAEVWERDQLPPLGDWYKTHERILMDYIPKFAVAYIFKNKK